MIESFNLVKEPWIPCVRANGAPDVLNLREIFAQAHELREIAGSSPLETAALHRFLLAILHRVFGPKNEDAWAKLWQSKTFNMDVLDPYLHQCRFDLFDKAHPFYQAPDKRVKPKSVINLSHDRASGNNATLCDHHTEEQGEELTPAQAARALITAQTFGLAGLSGIVEQKFTDGTGAGGILFLVLGDTLKETLVLNLLKYPPNNDQFGRHTAKDAPAWEMEDPFSDDRADPYGYLDYLTWQNRKILFVEPGKMVNKMTMGPALRYDPKWLDPMKNYRFDEKLGYLALSFSESRVFWRDSASLFAFTPKWEGKARPPETLRWLKELSDEGKLEKHKLYRILALGMSKKQAKVFFFRQEQLPLPPQYLTNEMLVDTLEVTLGKTGTIAFDLIQSARLAGMYQQLPKVEEGWQKQWSGLKPNVKGEINNWITHTGVEQNYWATLDIPFQSFIIKLAQDEENALADWHALLRKTAISAFEQIGEYTRNDSRAFKGMALGESYLKYRLNEVVPLPEKVSPEQA